MATNSNVAEQYEERIDSLLSVLDSSSSGDEEASDPTGSAISSKSKEEANRLDRWRLLEVEMKLLKEHYLTIVREKSVVIEEKNAIIIEKNRMTEEKSSFMEEKISFIEEKNQMFNEKRRMLEEKESEMRQKESLKHQLEEAMGQNKKLAEERDQLKQEQNDDEKRFKEELSEMKAQLDEQGKVVNEKDGEIENALEEKKRILNIEKRLENELIKTKEKLDEQVKLLSEKDDQVKKLEQQLGDKDQQTVSQRPLRKDYPKEVWFKKNERGYDEPLGIRLAELEGGGVCIMSVKPGSQADRLGLRIGDRVVRVGDYWVRKDGVESAEENIRRFLHYRSLRMLIDFPEQVDFL